MNPPPWDPPPGGVVSSSRTSQPPLGPPPQAALTATDYSHARPPGWGWSSSSEAPGLAAPAAGPGAAGADDPLDGPPLHHRRHGAARRGRRQGPRRRCDKDRQKKRDDGTPRGRGGGLACAPWLGMRATQWLCTRGFGPLPWVVSHQFNHRSDQTFIDFRQSHKLQRDAVFLNVMF